MTDIRQRAEQIAIFIAQELCIREDARVVKGIAEDLEEAFMQVQRESWNEAVYKCARETGSKSLLDHLAIGQKIQ